MYPIAALFSRPVTRPRGVIAFGMLALILTTPAIPVWASDCPKAPDQTTRIEALLSDVRDAHNEQAARLITNEMWAIWSTAPNAQAQEILDRGMRKRRSFDLLGAREDFDRLVEYCPDYAEPYNQRAFVNFINGEFDQALVDLDRAIALAPHHVAAIAGRALTLMGLGRVDEGQDALREVLKRHPWLPERQHLLPPSDSMPGQGGTDRGTKL